LSDGPDHVLDPHEVADAERLVDADRDRAEQVLHRLLRGEGERDAADAEPREEARHLEPELVQHRDEADREQRVVRELAAEREEPAEARVHPGPCRGRRDVERDVQRSEPRPEEHEVRRRTQQLLDHVRRGGVEVEPGLHRREHRDRPEERERARTVEEVVPFVRVRWRGARTRRVLQRHDAGEQG
jgi:hypothetical protein